MERTEDTMTLQKVGERQGSVHSHKITLRHLMLFSNYSVFVFSFVYSYSSFHSASAMIGAALMG